MTEECREIPLQKNVKLTPKNIFLKYTVFRYSTRVSDLQFPFENYDIFIGLYVSYIIRIEQMQVDIRNYIRLQMDIMVKTEKRKTNEMRKMVWISLSMWFFFSGDTEIIQVKIFFANKIEYRVFENIFG